MTENLEYKLKEHSKIKHLGLDTASLLREAATEIERLKEALTLIRDLPLAQARPVRTEPLFSSRGIHVGYQLVDYKSPAAMERVIKDNPAARIANEALGKKP